MSTLVENDSPDDLTAPPYADLQVGVTGADLLEAINKSGYPFQAVVADTIRGKLHAYDEYLKLQEEWAYIDSDTGQPRSIDIFAELSLLDPDGHIQRNLRVTPHLSLLVECKKSDTPYVFFLREVYPTRSFAFPEIAGLKTDDIQVFHDSRPEEVHAEVPVLMSLHDLMGFHHLPFFTCPSPFAISFSHAARKGSRLELTGEDAYRSITLPLFKAADHIHTLSKPDPTATSFALRFVVCLAVIKAPMIGVYLNHGKQSLIGTPWVRTCQINPITTNDTASDFREDYNIRYYDVIHESFLQQYLDILMRDLQVAAQRIVDYHEVIADGAGVEAHDDEHHPEHVVPVSDERKLQIETEAMGRLAAVPPGLEFNLDPDLQDVPDDQVMWLSWEDDAIILRCPWIEADDRGISQ